MFYCIYIYIIYIEANIGAISETQGSRKGHQQIWEGPIAYHAFVQKLCMAFRG